MKQVQRTLSIVALSVLCLLAGMIPSGFAQQQQEGSPGILVTPTRVVLEGKERSAVISLANNGTAPGSYRLSLVNKRMDDNGAISEVQEGEDALSGELFAQDLLRISPRRVSLEPGQHQNIRIMARKPKDLPPGEYRSHLRFSLVPTETPRRTQGEQNSDTLTIEIRANFGVTIPVIVRHGALQGKGSITTPQLVRGTGMPPTLRFSIERQGEKSLYGDLMVIYTGIDGREYVVKTLGGIAVYTPNSKRIFTLPLDVPEGIQVDKGKLEVIYREKAKEGGKIIAQNFIKL